jgi:hypothetical protein
LQGIVCCCAFRSARERCRHSIYRALRPWPSAADGTERLAEKRDADVRGRGGRGSKELVPPVGWVQSFRCTSLQLARTARCRQRKTSASFRPSRAKRTLSGKLRLRVLRRCGSGRGVNGCCRALPARPRRQEYQGDPTPPWRICGSFREPPHLTPPLFRGTPGPVNQDLAAGRFFSTRD